MGYMMNQPDTANCENRVGWLSRYEARDPNEWLSRYEGHYINSKSSEYKTQKIQSAYAKSLPFITFNSKDGAESFSELRGGVKWNGYKQ